MEEKIVMVKCNFKMGHIIKDIGKKEICMGLVH